MKSLREIYNTASAGNQLPTIVMVPCKNCRGLITIHRCADSTCEMWCDTCGKPDPDMPVMHPKKPEVVSSL